MSLINDNSFLFFSSQIETVLGFDDLEMISEVMKLPFAVDMINQLNCLGYCYAGCCNSDSKAYTDVYKKRIFIRRDKTPKQACLSLIYEMTNALNNVKILDVHKKYLSNKNPSNEKALEYSYAILFIEASAVFNRSMAAILLGIENEIKNTKYLQIIKKSMIEKMPQEQCLQHIFLEMRESGKVHNGKIRAIDYYIEQYMEFNK
jgi:hypothetical protein